MAPAPVTEAPRIAICYARQNRETVLEIAQYLRSLGAVVWFDGEITPGSNWREEVIEAIGAAEIVIIVLSQAAMLAKELANEVQYLQDANKRLVGLQIDTYGIHSPLYVQMRLNHRLDGNDVPSRRSACRRIMALLRPDVAYDEPVQSATRPLFHSDCPYPGPTSFTESQRDMICGRTAELKAAISGLQAAEPRLCMIYGPSGMGKTSFVQAQMIPALREGGFYTPPPIRISVPPKQEHVRDLFVSERVSDTPGVKTLADVGGYLVSRREQLATDHQSGTVIIFDQFEELFHYGYSEEVQTSCFLDIRNALQGHPRLRIVLVFREEYWGRIERSYEGLRATDSRSTPAVVSYIRVVLRPMTREHAIEAIRTPARRLGIGFDEGVAAAIADELRKVKVTQGNTPVVKEVKNYVEPVQLQIVCRTIWQHLREPVRGTIDRNEVGIAIRHKLGGAASLQTAELESLLFEFVADVLSGFYDDAIATAQTVEVRGKPYPTELIRMGCLQFVTSGGHRRLIEKEDKHKRVGRLPFEIVHVLENEHFLRADERGATTWYELAHDRLTEPVQKLKNPADQQLLLNLETLSAAMGRTAADRQGMAHTFEDHDSVLRGLRNFEDNVGLFEDEAEFVLRAALRSGFRLFEWGEGLCRLDFSAVCSAVLTDALEADLPEVRRNAVRLVCHLAKLRNAGQLPIPGPECELLQNRVFNLALSDTSEAVREAAAAGLADVATPSQVEVLVKGIADNNAFARRLFGRIHDHQERRQVSDQFDKALASLAFAERVRLFTQTAAVRGAECFRSIFIIALMSSLATAVTVLCVRGGVANFGLTLTQAEYKATMGMFHGVTGGFGWGFTISLAVTYCWIVLYGGHPWRGAGRVATTALAAATGGLLTGALLTLVIVNVFTEEALVKQGWIPRGAERMASITQTKMAFTMLVQGICVGLGCAFGLYTLCRAKSWQKLMRHAPAGSRPVSRRSLLWQLTKIALPHSIIPAVFLALGGLVLYQIFHPAEGFRFPRANLPYMILGDAFSIYSGALAVLVGTSYGFYLNMTGYTIEARRDILPNPDVHLR
ncbi:MAG: toll/interleukin-1 receptor domain-containing protein [Bryobacterales bacterium]|nr:toll/interleukin-1 receptor domain-containing protein [Bryobacterales bacterium]